MHVEGRLTRFQGEENIGSSTGEIIEFLRSGDVFVAVHTTTNDLFHTGAIRGNFRIVQTNEFIRSDVNADGVVDLTDPIVALEFLVLGQGTIDCDDAADANDDGQLDVSDPIASFSHQFLGDPIPAPGAGSCGFDPTGDRLGCEVFEECE